MRLATSQTKGMSLNVLFRLTNSPKPTEIQFTNDIKQRKVTNPLI